MKRISTLKKELSELLKLKEQYCHLSETKTHALLLNNIKELEEELEKRELLKQLKNK
jgi:hypothetical protein